jgi:hypothetical protein
MADLVGYPKTAGGDLTSGAIVATLEAMLTDARSPSWGHAGGGGPRQHLGSPA